MLRHADFCIRVSLNQGFKLITEEDAILKNKPILPALSIWREKKISSTIQSRSPWPENETLCRGLEETYLFLAPVTFGPLYFMMVMTILRYLVTPVAHYPELPSFILTL